MRNVKIRVDLKGFDAMMTKLTPDSLLGLDWRRGMDQASDVVAREVRSRAPAKTGRLQASVTTKLQARPIPMWAVVTAGASRRRFRYGWALNFSKIRLFRYRSGSRAGLSTYHWFTNAWGEKAEQVRRIIEAIATQIEARFNGHAG